MSPCSESAESDHDDQPVGGAILVRPQAGVGARGVRWGGHATRALHPHLAAGHRPLQQVGVAHQITLSFHRLKVVSGYQEIKR